MCVCVRVYARAYPFKFQSAVFNRLVVGYETCMCRTTLSYSLQSQRYNFFTTSLATYTGGYTFFFVFKREVDHLGLYGNSILSLLARKVRRVVIQSVDPLCWICMRRV